MRARLIAVFVGGLALALGGLMPGAACAQGQPAKQAVQQGAAKPIGKVVKLTGSVKIEHTQAVVLQASLGSGPNQAKVGDPVYLGDIVETGADGQIAITFADGTAFNLSKNARMTLNDFVYDPKGKNNSTLFSLAKGTFTFVAGKVAKTGNMEVDTPVATMGIRGTTPHVEISDDGTVKFSTLIEQGKTKVTEELAAPQRAHKSRNVPRHKINLNICQGC